MHSTADIPQKIQSEIYPDEKILWDYKPSWYKGKTHIFFMIPAILFPIFFMGIVTNDWSIIKDYYLIFPMIPIIVLFMFYFCNAHIHYILTNKRAIIIRRFSKQTIILKKELHIGIIKLKNNKGTIIFGTLHSYSQNFFLSIPDIDHVEKLIYNIQNNHQ